MATPALYSRYAANFGAVWAKHRRVLLVALVVGAFIPAVLERGFSFGPTPGRMLFVFMLVYFAAVAPVIAFRKEPSTEPSASGASAWAWVKALLCTAWALICVWAIYAGLRGAAV